MIPLLRVTALVAVAIPALALASRGQEPSVVLTGPVRTQMQEGSTYQITWKAFDVDRVTVTAEGELISRPDDNRGRFAHKIVDTTDMAQVSTRWSVPFLDTIRFSVRVKGYDDNGKLIAEDAKYYVFRPDILRHRSAPGIYIDLRYPDRQRLYLVKNNEVVRAYLTSGARTQIFLPKTSDSAQPHNHLGVFRVIDKYPMYWSREYKVWMTHAMRFWKGHFVHGTYPSEYKYLGTPASSGCVRLDRTDAAELYNLTPIGTRVEIFGN